MQMVRLDAMDLPTALALLGRTAVSATACLTLIVFCAAYAHGHC